MGRLARDRRAAAGFCSRTCSTSYLCCHDPPKDQFCDKYCLSCFEARRQCRACSKDVFQCYAHGQIYHHWPQYDDDDDCANEQNREAGSRHQRGLTGGTFPLL